MPGDPPRYFLDTNILIYASCHRSEKTAVAGQILLQGGFISVQVLNEFSAVARRKFSFSWPGVREAIEGFHELLTVVPLTAKTNETALNLAERYNLAFYDAVIAAAAHLADCTILYSEDMHHGLQLTKTLRVQNPFT
jgi:predicted nucleic acid-binding protein